MPQEACGPGPGVSGFCCPPCHSHFLSHTKCFLVSGSSILADCPWDRAMGWENWSSPREAPGPRAVGTRFGVGLGHVCIKDGGCFAWCTALLQPELPVASRAASCVCGCSL